MNFAPQKLAEFEMPAEVSELATAALANLRAAMNAVADETTNSEDETESAEGEPFAASTSDSDAPGNDAALSEPEVDAKSRAMSAAGEPGRFNIEREGLDVLGDVVQSVVEGSAEGFGQRGRDSFVITNRREAVAADARREKHSTSPDGNPFPPILIRGEV